MDDNKREFEDVEFPLSGEEKNKKKKSKGKPDDKQKKEPSKFVKKWKDLKKWKKVVIIIVSVIVVLALVAGAVVYGVYNGFRTNVNEENLGISTEIQDKYGDTDIFNVAIFGIDTRDEDSFNGRSDSIIIVSVDRANNTVKLTSILRDSYVSIDGHADQKITHAYSFGGAELAIKTINQNFHMNITDYATINFYKLADAIDVLGGIDIEITESEMYQINAIGDDEGKIIDLVNDYGNVHLNGDQASVYCRLREADSDVARSQRQKNVINALLVQARKVSPSKYPEVVKTIMSLCETSLSASEVMSFAPMITEEIDIQTMTVPGDEDEAKGGLYNGAWVWRYDLDKASERIHMFIYGEVPVFETTTKKNSSVTKKNNSKTTTTTKPETTEETTENVAATPKPVIPESSEPNKENSTAGTTKPDDIQNDKNED